MLSNEALFFIHIFAVVGLVLFARRIGKSALISFVVLQAIFANLFVIKQISLFGLQVTCSDVFAVGGILALNLLQEDYGKKEASKALYASFLGLLFFIGMSQFHLSYQPLVGDQTQEAFAKIFSNTLRISIASITVYFVVQKMDLFLFRFLQKLLGEKRLSLRVGISLTVSQVFDTVLFSFFGLYGIVSSVLDIILMSIAVKFLIILSCVVLLTQRKNVPV